ncbi:arsenate reductase ArsC [Phyllobacterium endophyticum]|uniref:Protein tyrosine phosphatase n=1 Tax=Phyllobacterium endophyticum TaxID=1149773 RepID=A0A2P7AMH2_9HYPH|nr:arsenate reductase ArsC [Phyllobacterium endophyticum]MBB3238362.1 protein-tyrosine-phosphatase [Phyllobacterium endophyticum]PSH55417.1 protein tyrosine phosphatase [Phyllobacterium endophyticum]TYR40143.1 arsenate reductase ArsC [Phyllobacterium endophyticum]
MNDKIFHVLFLSHRNSARSMIAEAILNRIGQPNFQAYSAGVEPANAIDPETRELLQQTGFPVDNLRPKHYREFGLEGARNLDFVFTLHDDAAGEPMPEWPGVPVTAHWESPDPLRAEGEPWERKQAFSRTMMELDRRLKIFINLPFSSLDRLSVQRHVDEIGRST